MEYVIGYGLAAAAIYVVVWAFQRKRKKDGKTVVSWLPGGSSSGPKKTVR